MIYLLTIHYSDFDMHFYYQDNIYYSVEHTHEFPTIIETRRYSSQYNDWYKNIDVYPLPSPPTMENINIIGRDCGSYISVCMNELEKKIFAKL